MVDWDLRQWQVWGDEKKTYSRFTLSVGFQLLTTGEDSHHPAWLRNNIHHGFYSRRTFYETFPATKDRRGPTVPVFTISLVRHIFLASEPAVGIFVLPIAACVLMQGLDFQHVQPSAGGPIGDESAGGTGLKLVDVRCGKGDGGFHKRGVFWSQRRRFGVLSNYSKNEFRVRILGLVSDIWGG